MVFEIGFMVSMQDHTYANATGKVWGFWPAGQNVFWICICLANLTLLKMHNNWTGWGEAIMFICISCYWPMVYLENLITAFPSVYKFWNESNRDSIGWAAAIFCLGSIMTIDKFFEVGVKYFTKDEEYWQLIFPSPKEVEKTLNLAIDPN